MNEHLNDYTLIRIRIVAADSIRDSIRTKISDRRSLSFSYDVVFMLHQPMICE